MATTDRSNAWDYYEGDGETIIQLRHPAPTDEEYAETLERALPPREGRVALADREKGLLASEEFVTSQTGGVKGRKMARYDLIPADALWELAEAYGQGTLKYDDDNWRRGYDWSLSFAAMQRHAWLFWSGEDRDPQTGTKHVVSVAWHALALAHYMSRTDLQQFDDRNVQQGINS